MRGLLDFLTKLSAGFFLMGLIFSFTFSPLKSVVNHTLILVLALITQVLTVSFVNFVLVSDRVFQQKLAVSILIYWVVNIAIGVVFTRIFGWTHIFIALGIVGAGFVNLLMQLKKEGKVRYK